MTLTYLYNSHKQAVANLIPLASGNTQFVGMREFNGKVTGMTPTQLKDFKEKHNLYYKNELDNVKAEPAQSTLFEYL